MRQWLDDLLLDLRTKRYLRKFPDDRPACVAIKAGRFLGARSAREAAEMMMARPLSDQEWSVYGARWKRAWAALTGKRAPDP